MARRRKPPGSLADLVALGNSLLTLYRILLFGSGAGTPPRSRRARLSARKGRFFFAASPGGSSTCQGVPSGDKARCRWVGVKWHGCPPILSGPQRDVAPASPLGCARHLGLKIEIQEELKGDWSQVHRRQLAFPFVGEPGFNHVRGEHITLEQPIVIPLQGVKHLT